ncbi:MAG: G1 family glutamic endopeptidase [Acidimicrobiales bacterium]
MEAPRKGAGRATRAVAAKVLRTVLFGVLAFSVVAATTVAVARPARRGRPGEPPPPTTASSSWSGELAWASMNGTSSFDRVTGAWAQPSVVATSSTQYADTWVGVDGYNGDLLQAGTTAWTRDGTVSYTPWFVAWNGKPSGMTVIDEPVDAGDRMSVAITREASGWWHVVLADRTAGWTWTTTLTYPAKGTSAEWIEEDPATWSTLSTYQTLADYGSVQFTTVSADGSAPDHVTGYEIAADGAVLSSPSTYDAARGIFTTRYGAPTLSPAPVAQTVTGAPATFAGGDRRAVSGAMSGASRMPTGRTGR